MKLQELSTGRYLLGIDEEGIEGVEILVEIYENLKKMSVIETRFRDMSGEEEDIIDYYWDILLDQEDVLNYNVIQKWEINEEYM